MAVAIRDGKFLAVGNENEVMQHAGPETQVIDLHGHTAVPGLNDSHLHLIRGGLNYNLELRWEGVPSLADALRMLKGTGAAHPQPAVGTGGGRLDRVSVCRTPYADAG